MMGVHVFGAKPSTASPASLKLPISALLSSNILTEPLPATLTKAPSVSEVWQTTPGEEEPEEIGKNWGRKNIS